MKILHVSHLYYPSIGGNQIHNRELSQKLAELNEQVTVFTSNLLYFPQSHQLNTGVNMPANENINGVDVRRFSINYKIYDLIFNKLSKLKVGRRFCKLLLKDCYEMLYYGPFCPNMIWEIIKLKPEIVLSLNAASTVSYFCCLAKKIFNFPLVIMPCFHIKDKWATNSMTRRILMSSDLIVTFTVFEKEFIINNHGIEASKIYVGGIGINVDKQNSVNKTVSFRNKFNLKDSPVVTFVGRFIKGKGIGTLIDAMQLVWKHTPDAKLILAGDKDYYLKIIKSKIEVLDNDYGKNIIFINNFHESEKDSIFDACDVFVMASNADSFGLVYLEAWLHGKPVIACKNTPQSTIIDDGNDGLLVEYGNEYELASAILKLLKNKELRFKLGENGKKKVLENYTWDIVARGIREEYYKLVNNGHQRCIT